MRTYRFGRKIILPSTIAIKYQIRKLMAEDEARRAGAEAAVPRPSCVPAPSIRLASPPSAGVRLVDPSGDEGSQRGAPRTRLTLARRLCGFGDR
jgi:hypothetical protein